MTDLVKALREEQQRLLTGAWRPWPVELTDPVLIAKAVDEIERLQKVNKLLRDENDYLYYGCLKLGE